MFSRHRQQEAEAGEYGLQATTDELLALRHPARELLLSSRQRATSAHVGPHGSRFRGRGMDYLESRAYQPGDDIRNMDWRVTARTGEPHTKVHQEERERPVVVVVDLSPSMFFGSRQAFKSVVAARAAAFVGWASVLSGDRIGALLFNGHHRELPPSGGRRGVVRLVRELVQATTLESGLATENASGGFNRALIRLRRVAHKGSLVVLLSDFYQADEQSRGHLLEIRRHSDLMLCHVVDPLELEPPPPGSYAISDGRRSGVLQAHRPAMRARYSEYFQSHNDAVKRLASGLATPMVRLRTDSDVVWDLRRALAGQRGRSRTNKARSAA